MSQQTQHSLPFSLAVVATALSARLGLQPIRRGTRTHDSAFSRRPVIDYIELVYEDVTVAKIRSAVSGLKTVQPISTVKDGFFSEYGHWVNREQSAPFQLKMRRYTGAMPSVRFTLTPIVAEVVKPKPFQSRPAAPKPIVVQDWELRPMGCEFVSSRRLARLQVRFAG